MTVVKVQLKAALTSAAALLVLTACATGGETAGVDVSHEGQLAYACALAEEAEAALQSQDDWESLEMIGDRADPAVLGMAAAASLTGGSMGFRIDGHEDLSDAGRDLIAGVTQVNVEGMAAALRTMTDTCAQDVPERPAAEQIAPEGRVDYACALTNHIREEHGDMSTWGGLGDEPAFHETSSVGALVGAANGRVLVEAPEISTAGADVFSSIVRLEDDGVDAGLEAVAQACAER